MNNRFIDISKISPKVDKSLIIKEFNLGDVNKLLDEKDKIDKTILRMWSSGVGDELMNKAYLQRDEIYSKLGITERRDISKEGIIYNYILSKGGEVLKTEIRDELKLVNKNKFKKEWESEYYPKLIKYAEEVEGKKIEEIRDGNRRCFKVTDIEDIEIIK